MSYEKNIREVSKGDIAFGLDLMPHLGDGNIIMSPYSIRTALAMLYEGAKGDTAKELSDALRIPTGKEARHDGFQGLISAINSSRNDFVLRTANGLWVDNTFGINPEFQADATKVYSAEAATADFFNNAPYWKSTINKWISGKTEEKIPELFKGNSINKNSVVVLANVLYLKAPWADKFDPAMTAKQEYMLADGSKITADLMRKGAVERKDLPEFHYGNFDGVQAVILPYKGMELAKLVLLPPKGTDVKNLEAHLRENPDALQKWMFQLRGTKFLRLELPRHESRKDYDLIPALNALGIKSVFDYQKADLSGVGRDKFGHPINVGTVVHEAYIKNNEEGSEGAAATGVGVERCMSIQPMAEFVADRPYIELIMNQKTGSVLFMNRIADPRK
jgi:serpin B